MPVRFTISEMESPLCNAFFTLT
jgi:hypothetical protein